MKTWEKNKGLFLPECLPVTGAIMMMHASRVTEKTNNNDDLLLL